ncbi:MAG: radical SAM protein, partial [Planktothrix sp.]
SFFGEVCLEAWNRNPNDFGRTVMDILEERLGRAPLEEALSAPIGKPEKQLATIG